MRPLLVLRIAHMEKYDGPAEMTSGGEYVRRHKQGGEVYNFLPADGNLYGYAMSLHAAGIHLGRLAPGGGWKQGDELPGVDVVFIAVRPGHGQVVVGWYEDATVFHHQYRLRRGPTSGRSKPDREYLCVAEQVKGTLLDTRDRNFPVPSAQSGNKGFPGQSNVWYPERHLESPGVRTFVKRLRKYMADVAKQRTGARPGNSKSGHRGPADAAHNAAVERAAVEATWAYLRRRRYAVKSVEKDCCGWDLEATKGQQVLLVEVKGCSRETISFELTPNEYKKLGQFPQTYRVCVVISALTAPRLFELTPQRTDGVWTLVSASDGVRIPLVEKIGAVATEAAPSASLAPK